MGNKANSLKNQINDEEDEAFYLEDWEIVTPKNMLKKPKRFKFDNNILISRIKSNPFDDYTQLKELGTGSYAKVLLVEHNITKAIRAMKVIQKRFKKGTNKTNEEDVINEVYLLMKMDHPNIVKIFEFYNGKNEYYLIMEYCSGGELFEKIVKSTLIEIQCAYLMYQILSAINYCHKMKIIHRDLKPENILIKKDEDGFYRVKICDFGTSQAFKIGDIQSKIVGSAYYIAPEVLQKKYNSKCDLWSCGVIMFVLLTKKPPFTGKNEMMIMKNVVIGKYKSELLDKYSPYAKDLVSKLLEKDIKKRINAETALNHPWFDVFKCKEILNDIQDKDMIKRFIENLKKYRSTSIIQETAIAYLVHNYPDNDEIVNACKLFGKIDTKGNGKITLEELSQGLSKLLKNKSMEEEAKKIFENLDVDGNNYIEYEEFVRAAIDKSIFLSNDALRLTFKFFDKENKEKITFDSILKMFEDCINKDKKISFKEELKEKLKDFVTMDDDFYINYSSFCDMMSKILK
jgi:calcium-dependent protein kinase